MNNSRRPQRKAAGLALEALEDRRLLATFGTPWPDARSLSVSFPGDQAAIGAYRNAAPEVLDQVADRLEWQEAALRAFQSWSVHANINVGLVADRGDDFGAVGLSYNDPRFGEFRIGAFPQVGVLANAIPYQQIAGSWAGDVLLNSNTNYFLGDSSSSDPILVPEPNASGPAVELFSVLLHEAGNALGLPDNDLPGAVMNATYSGPNGLLKPSDIAAIQQLYGSRVDIFETTSNNTQSSATEVQNPPGFNGSEPLSVNGSLNTLSDVDFYRVTPLPGKDNVSIRLWSSGISLLQAKLEVLDQFGSSLGSVQAGSVFENNLQLNTGSLGNHPLLFIRVERGTDDVFAIGDYRVDIDYRELSLQPSLTPGGHDDDDCDDDGDDCDGVDYVSVDALFDQFGFVDAEVGANDTLATATPLATPAGFLDHTRYELLSALAAASDRDLWSFQAPLRASPTLHIAVDPVTTQTLPLDVVLLNRNGDRIGSSLTRKADGGTNLVVSNPTPGEHYVLFVRSLSGSAIETGNYFAAVNFATDTAADMRTVFSQSVTDSRESISKLTTYKTQLFRFDLSSQAVSKDAGVQLSIYNAITGAIVAAMASANGLARTDYVWLSAGEYILRATKRVRGASAPGSVNFTLRADVISDDQGPLPQNPTGLPETPYPDWEWQQVPPTVPPPIIEIVIPLPEDPWSIDIIYSPYDDYYAWLLS
jgi:Matrixin